MIFNSLLESENKDVQDMMDDVAGLNQDPTTPEGEDNIADEIERNIQAAAL